MKDDVKFLLYEYNNNIYFNILAKFKTSVNYIDGDWYIHLPVKHVNDEIRMYMRLFDEISSTINVLNLYYNSIQWQFATYQLLNRLRLPKIDLTILLHFLTL